MKSKIHEISVYMNVIVIETHRDFGHPRVPPWVWKMLHHQVSHLGFHSFLSPKGPLLGLEDFFVIPGPPWV